MNRTGYSSVLNNSIKDCGQIVKGGHPNSLRMGGHLLALDDLGTIFYLRLGLVNAHFLKSLNLVQFIGGQSSS